MNQRSNIGYVITDSIRIGDTEYVIGKHETDPNRTLSFQPKSSGERFDRPGPPGNRVPGALWTEKQEKKRTVMPWVMELMRERKSLRW